MTIFNKIDLISEKQLSKVRKKIESLTEESIIETSYGELDINQLLQRRIHISRSKEPVEGSCGCSNDHHCSEHSHVHLHSFKAMKIDVTKPVNRIQLEKWLKSLPETIVRGKGILQFTETVGKFQFQYASNQLQFQRLKETTIEPCIILIGTGLDINRIEQSFIEQCQSI